MISLIQWKEFGADGEKSIKTSFCKERYEHQDEIEKYLAKGNVVGSKAGFDYDVFTGERIPGFAAFMNDGEYSWSSALLYYVKRYNMRLPVEFENKVIAMV